MYKLTEDANTVIEIDGSGIFVRSVPKGSKFWGEYTKWLNEGNTPEPADDTTGDQAARTEVIRAEIDGLNTISDIKTFLKIRYCGG